LAFGGKEQNKNWPSVITGFSLYRGAECAAKVVDDVGHVASRCGGEFYRLVETLQKQMKERQEKVEGDRLCAPSSPSKSYQR
jgi:hypothetical protein